MRKIWNVWLLVKNITEDLVNYRHIKKQGYGIKRAIKYEIDSFKKRNNLDYYET